MLSRSLHQIPDCLASLSGSRRSEVSLHSTDESPAALCFCFVLGFRRGDATGMQSAVFRNFSSTLSSFVAVCRGPEITVLYWHENKAKNTAVVSGMLGMYRGVVSILGVVLGLHIPRRHVIWTRVSESRSIIEP